MWATRCLDVIEVLLTTYTGDNSALDMALCEFATELELVERRQNSKDPLDRLFHEMLRYQTGQMNKGEMLSLLSRYEVSLLGLKESFEKDTDPVDTREPTRIMRMALLLLEGACKKLRENLREDADHAFDDIKSGLVLGTGLLRKYKNSVVFTEAKNIVEPS